MAIAAGGIHSLALQSNGTVVAWGAGTNNTGSWPDLGQAMVPAGLTNVVAVAAGAGHSLALKADGTVVAWQGRAARLRRGAQVAGPGCVARRLEGEGTDVHDRAADDG